MSLGGGESEVVVGDSLPPQKKCEVHGDDHKWIEADEWGYNCVCGAYKVAA